MILYQYPKKKSVFERRAEKNNSLVEGKKLKKNLIISFAVSIIIIAVSFYSKVWWVMIICILIAMYNFSVSYIAYRIYIQYSSDKVYTKLFDDKIIHYQPCLFSNKIKRFEIKYEDITFSKQGRLGEFEIHLNGNYTSEVSLNYKDTKTPIDFKDNIAILKFSSIEPKMYIIDNYSSQFKYMKVYHSNNI